jgi:hypothetical protein
LLDRAFASRLFICCARVQKGKESLQKLEQARYRLAKHFRIRAKLNAQAVGSAAATG